MTTWKQLSAPLRLTIAAPWCLLVALLFAGAAGMIDVKIDPTSHQPINTTVSLSGTHWTGTLDADRLPASVPRYDDSGNIPLGTAFIGQAGGGLNFDNEGNTDGFGNWLNINTLTANSSVTTAQIYSYGGDPSIDLSDPTTLVIRDDGTSVAEFTYGTVNLPGTLTANGLNVTSGGAAGGDWGVGGDLSVDGTIFGDGSNLSGVVATGLATGGPALYADPSGRGGWISSNDFSTYGNLSFGQDLIDPNGNIVIDSDGEITSNAVFRARGDGVILLSPGGNPFQLRVDDSGNFSTSSY